MKSPIESYECKVDAKFRLPIPAGLKKYWAEILEEGFVLKRSVFQPCIEIHTMSDWNKISKKLDGLNQNVKKNQDLVRHFKRGLKIVEVDATGRIQIPKELVAFAGISKDVVLAPSIKTIEIWDKDRYEELTQVDEVDFAALVEEVLGDLEDENDVS